MGEAETKRRRVLYFHGNQPGRFAAMVGTTGEAGVAELAIDGIVTQWIAAATASAVMNELRERYVNLIVVDMRPGTTGGLELLDQLAKGDVEERYGFHRILALVGDPDPETLDQTIAELGFRGVQGILSDRSTSKKKTTEFVARVRSKAVRMLTDRARGRTAICSAGGGITAIFFELGALKCIDDVLPDGALHDFDMYFGISAGAIVNSVLAAGYSIDEFMAAIAGVEGGRIPPTSLNLMRLGHLNWRDALHRIRNGVQAGAKGLAGVLSGRVRPSMSGLFLDTTAMLGTPFRSDAFGELLQGIFNYPGTSNDFRKLPRQLFVGASDQDSRQHRLFGSQGNDHIPIHKAVQASLSLNPAFSAVEVEGRFYEDGQVTRTSNFGAAIERGADLVLVLDPFVPFVSKTPGVAKQRGLLYHIDQDIRSLSFTRFLGVRDTLLRRHPEVSAYTFVPANHLRQLLSVNPMDHRPYLEIFKGAYLSTLARLELVRHKLRGDLNTHGWKMSLDRAQAVAEQLWGIPDDELSLADFYPDRRLAIKTPPLPFD